MKYLPIFFQVHSWFVDKLSSVLLHETTAIATGTIVAKRATANNFDFAFMT